MSEQELLKLCSDLFDNKKEADSIEGIQSFFTKLINQGKMIDISPEIRKFIPKLANIKNGVLCPMITESINGISPMDYVPELNLKITIKPPDELSTTRSTRFKSSRKSENIEPQSARDAQKLNELERCTREICTPRTSRPLPNAKQLITSRTFKRRTAPHTHRQLPPLEQTEDDILSKAYISSKDTMYMGKKLTKEAINIHIIPPGYPCHMIGTDYSVITPRGIVSISNQNGGSVQALHEYARDKTCRYLVENQMISKRISYRAFYHWRSKLRDKLFSKIIRTFNYHFKISIPNFTPVMEKIRGKVLESASNVFIFPQIFDIKNDEVELYELKQASEATLYEVTQKISTLKDIIGAQVSEVFRIIRAAEILIQLGYDELSSLNQLPPSLQQYSSDLKWRVPSLWREKMREQQLQFERVLARERKIYLSTFFSKVRIVYNGTLILKCKEMISNFVDRFCKVPINKRRAHRIQAVFDQANGYTLSPSREEFLKYFKETIGGIKSAHFQHLDVIWREIILEVDPNYRYDIENPITVIDGFEDLQQRVNEAAECIENAYSFLESEVKNHSRVVMRLMEALGNTKGFTNIRSIEALQDLLNKTLNAKNEFERLPKNIFHTPSGKQDTMIDFVASMWQASDSVRAVYAQEMSSLKLKIINELNLLFGEIQDKWSAIKEKKITRLDARALEARTLQYSLLCDVFSVAWGDSLTDIKGSFDTVMKMYRQLADKSRYTHAGAAMHFNKVAETLGLGAIPVVEEEEEEEEDYYEYEEDYSS